MKQKQFFNLLFSPIIFFFIVTGMLIKVNNFILKISIKIRIVIEEVIKFEAISNYY